MKKKHYKKHLISIETEHFMILIQQQKMQIIYSQSMKRRLTEKTSDTKVEKNFLRVAGKQEQLADLVWT